MQVDFGFSVDANGASLPVVSLTGDTNAIVGDHTDDRAIVRVANMKPDIPVIDLGCLTT